MAYVLDYIPVLVKGSNGKHISFRRCIDCICFVQNVQTARKQVMGNVDYTLVTYLPFLCKWIWIRWNIKSDRRSNGTRTWKR